MRIALTLLLIALSLFVRAQKVENIIIITTDGLRWQEVFTGMDRELANSPKYNQGDSAWLYNKYWSENLKERRSKLLPNFWKILVPQGRVYGNRGYGNRVDTRNDYHVSYPGYAELFCGYADEKINSNSYPLNPNKSLLEFFNEMDQFKGKVAAFGAWHSFDRILNEKRAGFPVISGLDTLSGQLTDTQKLIHKMLRQSYKPWLGDECLDIYTHYMAFEYLKINTPKVFFIGYGETDEMAHAGDYRDYLNCAHQFDEYLGELWAFLQNHPQYKNKTAILITTDHGRGDEIKRQWTSHGVTIDGSGQTWFALISPGVSAMGEMVNSKQYHQDQLAQTLANLMGYTFTSNHPVADGISIR